MSCVWLSGQSIITHHWSRHTSQTLRTRFSWASLRANWTRLTSWTLQTRFTLIQRHKTIETNAVRFLRLTVIEVHASVCMLPWHPSLPVFLQVQQVHEVPKEKSIYPYIIENYININSNINICGQSEIFLAPGVIKSEFCTHVQCI